ncbi:MAG: MFS transporter [Desulfobacterales bacterium]|nr:MFS transporter [Desulfobacterales bacterium]
MTKLNKKIFGTLFFSIFASVTGVGIVVPLLPVYAHDLGASGLYIGLIFGAFSLSRTFFLPYFGRLSDVKGRKPFIVFGLLAYTIISIAFIFSHDVETLIAIRFIQGIASAMIMPVTQAYVGDITPEGQEGFVMGLFNMSVFFGLSIGPLIGGIISDRLSLSAAFACMGALSAFGVILSYLLLPGRKNETAISRNEMPIPWMLLLKDRDIIGYFLFRFTYTFCIGIIWGFLPIMADVKFSLSSGQIGILLMLAVFISGIINTPMGYLADRINRKGMILFGGLLVTLSVYAFIPADGFQDLFWANILFGLGGGIAMPPLMALVVIKGNQTESMGSVVGLMTMSHSMGMMAGSLLAGLIMDISKLDHAFPFGALLMISGMILFTIFTWHRTPLKISEKDSSGTASVKAKSYKIIYPDS